MKLSLTDREADIMQVLWEHSPSLVTEARERFSDKFALATVLTVLRALQKFSPEQLSRMRKLLSERSNREKP